MPSPISPETFEKFAQERRYLYNVSPNTEQLYRNAWGKWQKYGLTLLALLLAQDKSGSEESAGLSPASPSIAVIISKPFCAETLFEAS